MKDFPPFQLDTVKECLWRRRDKRDDERILLTPKAFGVLNYLIERAGQLVTHDELLDAVWQDTFIQPQAVKKIILAPDHLGNLVPVDYSFTRFASAVGDRAWRNIEAHAG